MVFLNLIDSAEDKEKFKHFYNKYVGMVIWIAKSRLRDNQSLAEECAQETFLYFAKNFSKIEEVDSLKTKSYVGVVATAYAIKSITLNSSATQRFPICRRDSKKRMTPSAFMTRMN